MNLRSEYDDRNIMWRGILCIGARTKNADIRNLLMGSGNESVLLFRKLRLRSTTLFTLTSLTSAMVVVHAQPSTSAPTQKKNRRKLHKKSATKAADQDAEMREDKSHPEPSAHEANEAEDDEGMEEPPLDEAAPELTAGFCLNSFINLTVAITNGIFSSNSWFTAAPKPSLGEGEAPAPVP